MARQAKQYTKLSGRSVTSVQTCYLGEDHLLVLDGYYTETQRKLYYKDIEAILITKTNTGKVCGVIAILFLLLFLIIALSNLENGGWIGAVIFMIFPALFIAYIGYQNGTAAIGVQTSVQTATLDGVRTYRKARKVEAKLAKRIEAVQGRLTQEELEAALFKDASSTPQAAGVTAPPIPPMPVATPRPETEGDALSV